MKAGYTLETARQHAGVLGSLWNNTECQGSGPAPTGTGLQPASTPFDYARRSSALRILPPGPACFSTSLRMCPLALL